MRFNLHRTLMVAGGTLAIAGLMAAYSYTTATVTNAASLNVVNSNQALLGLMPGSADGATPGNNFNSSPDKDQAAYLSNGNLVIDFNRGLGGGDFGMQPNSTYFWDGLFTVENNSSNAVKVTITANNVPAGATLMLQQGEDGTVSYGKGGPSYATTDTNDVGGLTGGSWTFTLPAGGWQEIDAQVQVGATATPVNSSNMTINVAGAAVGGDL